MAWYMKKMLYILLLTAQSHLNVYMTGTQKQSRSPSSPQREEGWQAAMAKSSQSCSARVQWGLRCHLNSFVFIVFVLFVILAISFTTNNGDLHAPELAVKGENVAKCDLFSGQWVYDDSRYPLYQESACKFMSDQLACEKFGRTNVEYQYWRWQPHGCDLPRFNATKLLERLHGKRMVFVGDSLNRNQWVSMVCLLDTSTAGLQKSMQSNGSLMSFKVKEYNASIDFYWSPLLAESNSDDPVHHRVPDRTVRTQSIGKHARNWNDADVLVFNTYLWWRRPEMKVLWGSFDEDGVYKKIESLRAYELTLRTWSDWLEFHVNHNRTKLFFMSMSPTHLRSDEWETESNQSCYNVTELITVEGYRGRNSDGNMTEAVEAAVEGLKQRGVRVQILNITQMSEYRKDAHPSVFRKQWDPLTEEQLKNPSSYADCIHWCLPGVPDVWNELFYAYTVS